PETRGPAGMLEIATCVVDISPEQEVPLGASNAAGMPWAGVHDTLEANLVLLSDGGRFLLLGTFDLLYVGATLRRIIVEASGLAPEDVVLAASHTHRAPMTDPSKPNLGMPDPRYMRQLERLIKSAVM